MKKIISLLGVAGMLVMVPACDWMKNSTEQAPVVELEKEVVVSFGGKPVITGADYEKSLVMLMQAQPAFQQMLPFMGAEQQAQIYQQIAESLAQERVMHKFIKDNGIDKTAEFKENARQIHEAVDRDLAMRAFQNEIVKGIVTTDEEAQKYYDINKDKAAFKRPPFLISASGVKAQAIVVSSAKEAQEIATQARQNQNFSAVAKSFNKTVNDLGAVSAQSMAVDSTVKNKILAAKKFPSVEVIKGSDKKEYVVKMTGKQDEKFADFSQPEIKEAVKEMMLGEKFTDAYNKKINELKAEYNVVINKDYLAQRSKPAQTEETQPAPQPSHTSPQGA